MVPVGTRVSECACEYVSECVSEHDERAWKLGALLYVFCLAHHACYSN